jgi:hypothetical protein
VVHFYSSDNALLVDDVRGFISAIILLYTVYADDGGFEVALSVRIPGTAVLEYDKPKLGSDYYFPVFAEDTIVFVLHAALLHRKW